MNGTTRIVNMVISIGVVCIWAVTSFKAGKPLELPWGVVALAACGMGGKSFEKILEWRTANK